MHLSATSDTAAMLMDRHSQGKELVREKGRGKADGEKLFIKLLAFFKESVGDFGSCFCLNKMQPLIK